MVNWLWGSKKAEGKQWRPMTGSGGVATWLGAAVVVGLLAGSRLPARAQPPTVLSPTLLLITRYGGERPPGRAIGHFRGYDAQRKADNDLVISSNGSVRLRGNFRSDRHTVVQSGWYRNGRLEMDRGTIGIYRDGNAVRTVEVGEEHARVRYRRQ
jgi:hypothetical protein